MYHFSKDNDDRGSNSGSSITIYDARYTQISVRKARPTVAKDVSGKHDNSSRNPNAGEKYIQVFQYTVQQQRKNKCGASSQANAAVKRAQSAFKETLTSHKITNGRDLDAEEKAYQNCVFEPRPHLSGQLCHRCKEAHRKLQQRNKRRATSDPKATVKRGESDFKEPHHSQSPHLSVEPCYYCRKYGLSTPAKDLKQEPMRNHNNFGKSILSECSSKPRDCDVLFENANFRSAMECGWKCSRLEAMHSLERNRKCRAKNPKLKAGKNVGLMDMCCFPFIRNLLV